MLDLIAQALKLLNQLTGFLLSKEQVAKRNARGVDSELQDFSKALAVNDSAFVNGYCVDLNNRVRAALRGGAGRGNGTGSKSNP